MRRFLCTFIIIGTGCLALSATADKVYKWVDQQGVTHYSEQPPADKKAAMAKIKLRQVESKATQPQTIESGNEAPQPQSEVETALSTEQLAVQRKNCVTARNKLRALQNAGRVRQLDADSGEYIYLPDEVKLAQIQQMSDYLRAKCAGE
jgi:hypothetical protein